MKIIYPIIALCILCLNGILHADTWTQKSNVSTISRGSAFAFSIANKGYVGTGADPSFSLLQDFWEWDPGSNAWTQRANFGGGNIRLCVSFSIGNKGYAGTGLTPSSSPSNIFWEWDQGTNTWSQKASFPGSARYIATGFSIGNKGYIGLGWDGGYKNDFWEWDQNTNTWTQKAAFIGTPRYETVGFSLGGFGYVGLGWDGSLKKDFYQFDPSLNTWTKKADFPGAVRETAVGFPIGCYGYVGVGFSHDAPPHYNDFYQYDPAGDTWTKKADFPSTGRGGAIGLSIGNKGYIGTGADQNGTFHNDFWEYDPALAPVSVNATATSVCFGQPVTLTATGGTSYSWSTGETTSSITISPLWSASYSVTGSGACGSNTASVNIVVSSVTIDPGPPQTICFGDTTSLSAGTYASSFTWSPANSLSSTSISNPGAFPSATTTYTVIAANSQGCTAVDSQKIYVMPVPATPTITSNGNVLTSSPSSSYQWYLNGGLIPGAISQSYTAVQSGMYQVAVTDTNGCGAISSAYNLLYNGAAINTGKPSNIVFTRLDGYVQIEMHSAAAGKVKIVVTNSLGQVFADKEISPDGLHIEKIDIRGFASGIYFFSVFQGRDIYTFRLITE